MRDARTRCHVTCPQQTPKTTRRNGFCGNRRNYTANAVPAGCLPKVMVRARLVAHIAVRDAASWCRSMHVNDVSRVLQEASPSAEPANISTSNLSET